MTAIVCGGSKVPTSFTYRGTAATYCEGRHRSGIANFDDARQTEPEQSAHREPRQHGSI
jgi:hypothetical protein